MRRNNPEMPKMTCKHGECGTVHNFGKKYPSCDCGMFTVNKRFEFRAEAKTMAMYHPTKDLLEALQETA